MTSPRPKTPAVVVSAVRPRDSALVPSERDVLTGRLTGLDRDDKNRRRDDHDVEHGAEPAPATGPAPVPRPRFPRWAVVAAGAAVVVVVAGGVAVASGALGGGDAPASDTTATDAAGTDGGGSGDGGADGGLPPELDPAQVVGYTMTSTRTEFEFGAGINADEVGDVGIGTTRESVWECTDGVCNGLGVTFRVGDSSIAAEFEEPTGLSDDVPCFPVMIRHALTLQDDGTYTGTSSREPTQLYAEYSTDGGSGSCSSVRYVDELVVVPILAD